MNRVKFFNFSVLSRGCSVLILFLCTTQIIFAQSSDIDSLDARNFDELRKIFYHYKNAGQNEIGKKVAFYTLKRARKEGNEKAITNSFIRLCRVSYDTLELALKYTDSSIYFATKYKQEDLLAEGHFYKGIVLFDLGKYGSSLDNYLEANKYYQDKNNEMHYVLNHNIALLKLKFGPKREALNIFKENLDYYNEQKKYGDLYLSTLYGLSIAYVSNNKKDSASIINKKGYEVAKLTEGFSHLYFTQAEGALQYINGNFITAKDSLLKSIPFLKSNKDYPNLAISYFYLGSIAENDIDKIKYFKRVDSIFQVKRYIIPAPRKAYEGLINYYKNKGDLKNQLHYTERLLVIDTVINKEYRNVSRTFQYEYDTPKLLADQELLISKLNSTNKDFKYGIYILLFILILVLGVLVSLYKKKKNNEKKFKKIISSLKRSTEKVEGNKLKEKRKKSSIDEKTLNQILEKLEQLEKDKVFLTPKLTLNLYAKKIDTNSKYLSRIINDHKSQTFNNYVNNLRITYIIEELYSNQVLRNYTINAIAKEAGFSSTETFTRAFAKKTGLNVSYFLKKLND